MKGDQEPAVAPNKGRSDQAQGIIVVLCPNGPFTSDVQGCYHLCGCGQLTSKPMDKGTKSLCSEERVTKSCVD